MCTVYKWFWPTLQMPNVWQELPVVQKLYIRLNPTQLSARNCP